jgi:hypothetical protein
LSTGVGNEEVEVKDKGRRVSIVTVDRRVLRIRICFGAYGHGDEPT